MALAGCLQSASKVVPRRCYVRRLPRYPLSRLEMATIRRLECRVEVHRGAERGVQDGLQLIETMGSGHLPGPDHNSFPEKECVIVTY